MRVAPVSGVVMAWVERTGRELWPVRYRREHGVETVCGSPASRRRCAGSVKPGWPAGCETAASAGYWP